MKKILITLSALFMLAGCTSDQDSVDPKMELLVKENTLLQDKLDERPPLNADQLRETMNLSLKAFAAMAEKDYEYLESIADSNVTINKDTSSFQFEDGYIQDFLQTINFSKLEYRFHNLENDIITVGYAEMPAEYHFEFILKDDQILLHSFLTN
ncbi:lipoprotein [Mesobacillus subterraneus]|uniref:lipoprotein n=1 Tax=Mesobacillus subterraneus TaxID=285983 RepID=UPI00203ED460|nr:lipoprotein [Mesobacillus subterraneus]MCM3666123.1 lipoprotein [Mesobacillus subterraneus]MCM3685121.1 lipoprotein [Mesobacillus subterraneus]